MGVSPLFQCSFCLQGLGPFGGPCVALLEGRVCVLCFSVLSACKGWGHLVVPVYLCLRGPCVCVLCFSVLSACTGWGHLVAPVYLCLRGVCLCVSFVSVFLLLARLGARWWPLGALGGSFLMFLKPPGSLFGTFWHHFGRLGLPVATFQALLAPYG